MLTAVTILNFIVLIFNTLVYIIFINVIKGMVDLKPLIPVITVIYAISILVTILTHVANNNSLKRGYKTPLLSLMGIIQLFYGYLFLGVMILFLKDSDYYHKETINYSRYCENDIITKEEDKVICEMCGYSYNINEEKCPNCGEKNQM